MSTFTPSAEQAAIIDAPVDADVLVVAGAGAEYSIRMTITGRKCGGKVAVRL